ncbi:putative sortase-sorted surface anchored protein (pseudogene) [Streptococcus pneumoniae]|nr:putative sortase-sorted surface anchored protein (pseudogene) [Streptococcus pneumoniae]
MAELISENVKVRYVDEQGRLLSLKNDTGIGEKESDGTYITNKKQLIGTSYNVTDKKLSSMTTTDGKYYTFKEVDTNSASLTRSSLSSVVVFPSIVFDSVVYSEPIAKSAFITDSANFSWLPSL